MASVPQIPGFHDFVVMAGMQHCSVSIPKKFNPELPTPAILALHWGGPISNDIGKSLLEELIIPGLEDIQAIIIAPHRIREHWATPEAEEDLINLWRFFQDNYKFDLKKTAITGYSMGGIGAWQMAAKHPELFKAAIPISAQPPAIVSTVEWKIPTYVIHSERDEIFPSHYTIDIVNDLISSEADVQLNLIEDLGHFEIPQFILPLREAAVWLQKIWENHFPI